MLSTSDCTARRRRGWPAMKPSSFACAAVGASSAVAFTSGLRALAKTNDSPFAARSTGRYRCVFASWMATLRMAEIPWTNLR